MKRRVLPTLRGFFWVPFIFAAQIPSIFMLIWHASGERIRRLLWRLP